MQIRRDRLESGDVLVVDGAAPEDAVAALHRGLLEARFRRGESARLDTLEVRHWALELAPARFRELALGETTDRLVEEHFPGEGQSPYRVYVNAVTHGDLLFAHRDCEPPHRHVTALWFVCESWQAEWGGEILFFDEPGDARVAVSPRPGRVCLFRGTLRHRGTAPERSCFATRYTLAVKYAPGGLSGAK